MAFKTVLLYLPTYPESVPEQGIEDAFRFARDMGATLTIANPELGSDPGAWPVVMGSWPLDIPAMMKEALATDARNRAEANAMLARAEATYGVKADVRRLQSQLYGAIAPVIDIARLRDLTLLPFPQSDSFDRKVIEAILFESGRPCLLMPCEKGRKPLRQPDRVVVAWNYSRAAARAVSDALPLLSRAKVVTVLSIFGEKEIQATTSTQDIHGFLAAHGISSHDDHVALGDKTVAEVMRGHALKHTADLLVMGGYGHSRLREFVMGGATRGILADPPLPIFLSH